ncbi:uncharacterized protein LOC141602011 [Silene latifolia]|uniref:uncharacterized protein LOC141602011 n=1 Tax=Silene latifolia TaxID=37657 RepID=UPI003D78177B
MVFAKKNAKKSSKKSESKMDVVESIDTGVDIQMDDAPSTEKGADSQMVEAKPRVKRVHEITVSCRPQRLVSLIEKLNEDQVSAVKKIGFGGLLELKISSFPLAHVRLFLESFSDGSYVFRASRKKEFMIRYS